MDGRILLLAVAFCFLSAGVVLAEDATNVPQWTTSLNLGLNSTRGNSKTTAGNGSLLSERKGGRHEFSLGIEGNYAQSEETKDDGSKEMETTVQNEKGYAKYRFLFTDRDYGYLDSELSQDRIADIKYRLILGPGLGRYLIQSEKNTLGAEGGISWIKDKVNDELSDRLALRAAEKYERKISETAKFWQNVEYLPAVDDLSNYLVNGEVGIEAAINAKSSLRFVAQDHYNSKPASDKEKNDFIITAGFGYKL